MNRIADEVRQTMNGSGDDPHHDPPTDAPPPARPWPTLDARALHGLAGEIVRAVAPFTEADPVAVLVHVLAAFGNMIGDGPRQYVGEDVHPARLSAVVVGATGSGRKGTAASVARSLLTEADPEWGADCLRTGLSSGEGLIYHVRDAVEEEKPVKTRGRVTGYETVRTDAGVKDKRLFVVEPEFSSVLRRMRREGCTLSTELRAAWETGNLGTLTKDSPLRATGAHVTVIGHITPAELRQELTDLDAANGFGNRFLFVVVRRSKLLPEAPRIPEPIRAALAAKLRAARDAAREIRELQQDETTMTVWKEVYPRLTADRPGLAGALLGRMEAQTHRLNAAYALLDGSGTIRPAHLAAALAVMEYVEASVYYLFGQRLGGLADTIADMLRLGPMTRTQISNALGRNVRSAQITAALTGLEHAGRARRRMEPDPDPGQRGRPAEVWELVA